jgi:fatty-acyl-CoA synthase
MKRWVRSRGWHRSRDLSSITSSYVRGPSEPPLTDLTIPAALRKTVEANPHREAAVFRFQNKRFNYEQFEIETNKIAAGLIAAGLEPGDRLGLWSHNHPEWLLTQFAAAKAGLILVNVNPSYRPSELSYAIEKCQIKGLISDTKWLKQDYLSVLSETLEMKKYKSLEFVSFLNEYPSSIFGSEIRTFQFSDFGQGAGTDDFTKMEKIISKSSADDVCNIQFTSGTTGSPKGACLTHHNVNNNALVSNARLETTMEDIYLVNVPLYHCFGCVGAALGMSLRY